MSIIRILVIVLLFHFNQTFASENLTPEDFEGNWVSDNTFVDNEKQILKISMNAKSTFERHFEGSFSLIKLSIEKDKSQTLESVKSEINGDVLTLVFNSKDNIFGYKLVLSGWKSQTTKLLYGSMFLYRKGVQFNMLPVSFIPSHKGH